VKTIARHKDKPLGKSNLQGIQVVLAFFGFGKKGPVPFKRLPGTHSPKVPEADPDRNIAIGLSERQNGSSFGCAAQMVVPHKIQYAANLMSYARKAVTVFSKFARKPYRSATGSQP
jgi:hypothetical protein